MTAIAACPVSSRRTVSSTFAFQSFNLLITRLLLTRSLTSCSVKAFDRQAFRRRPFFHTAPFSLASSGFERSLPSPRLSCRLFATRTRVSIAPLKATSTPVLENDVSDIDEIEMWPNFCDLQGLHAILQHNVATNMKFSTMTEIQAKTWEAASAGTDVLGRARTGTGKTVAFLLPSIQQLLQKVDQKTLDSRYIHMLILSPTRELAAQIGDQAQMLCGSGNSSTIRHQVMFGGASKPKDVTMLERHVPAILVATPGRLKDHLQTSNIRGQPFAQLLSQTSILVLDETDRLLDMGFRRDVEDIISYLPNKEHRQTLLFSATVPPEVKAVMAQTMRSSFVTVDCIHDTDPASHTNSQVDQSHVIVPSTTRLVTGTVDIITKLIDDTKAAGEPLKLVVFFNTAHMVAFYASLFNDGLGIDVLELHSRKSQSFRTRTADAFRAATQAILFTSDVSARGVDYPGVTDVVQFGIPDSRESYIHRLGRTGRAGKKGEGLLVLTDLERKFLQQLNGIDVPEHVEYQALIDGAASTPRLNPILTAIGDGSNKDLASNARAAYRSMLGFYNGKLAKLGVPGTDRLVAFVNGFAQQTGLLELPELETKTVKKMGLVGANGLNIVKNASIPNNRGGGGGGGGGGQNSRGNEGGRGGGGGGRGGGRGDQGQRTNGGRGGEGGRGNGSGGGGGGRGGGRGRGNGGRDDAMAMDGGNGGRGSGRRQMSTAANGGGVAAAATAPSSAPTKRHSPSAEVGVPKKPKPDGSGGDGGNAPKSNNNRRRYRRPAGTKDGPIG